MEGTPTPQTFRLLGSLHHQVVILVDGDSTHNFIQSGVAKFLTLPSAPTTALRVMVGNGYTLDCDTLSLQVLVSIQGHSFTLDLFLLPICGADIELGVQWLKLLGPITTNYQALTMTFVHMGRKITFRVDAPPLPSSASAHHNKRLAQIQSISALFPITTTPAHPSPSSPPTNIVHTPAQITSVITRYTGIFTEPSQLPPPCNIQHHIHLLLHTTPVNVKTLSISLFPESEN